MKGDYSKISFNERKKMQHYRKVYLQQGKVLLDSDLNENTDLLHYQMKTLAKDGLCGSPNIGFRIGRGVPLLPVDNHRYIADTHRETGWFFSGGTLKIDYFEKFEGKGSLKVEFNGGNEKRSESKSSLKNAAGDIGPRFVLSFKFEKPIDLSQYRYLMLALKTDDGANPKLTLKRLDGENEITGERNTSQNDFLVIKYIFPDEVVLDNITEIGLSGFHRIFTYHIGALECSPPMFTLEPMTHLEEMSLKNNFVIAGADPLSGEPGRLYVDGELYEKEEAETYLNQKDYPSAPFIKPVPDNGRIDLVYVDVWQRHVTSAEDPELREVAVGVDTCNRMKAVAQVKILEEVEEGEIPLDLKPTTGGGRLSTIVENIGVEKPCGEITSGDGYVGLENRLYRVEIHTGGDVTTATYKWSKDNASTVSQIIENVAKNATSVRVKDVELFKIGDIIEITDDRAELADRKYISETSSIRPWGELRRIDSIDRDKNELTWANAPEASNDPLSMTGGLPHDYTAEGVETTHPRVIKWDGAEKTSSEETLEDGIKIRFSGSDMLPGDYWTFTAREKTRAVEKLDNEPPQGVVHHYYPLAVIEWDEHGEIRTITDLRTRFEPLCGLTAADLAFDNANTQLWEDARNVQQALERITFPKAEGIKFTNHFKDIYIMDGGPPVWHINILPHPLQPPKPRQLGLNFGEDDADGRLFIQSGGNVGIGTMFPNSKLDVRGNISSDNLSTKSILNEAGNLVIWSEEGVTIRNGLWSEADKAYTLTTQGRSYAKQHAGWGFNYAEYFESVDGKEISAGTSVVLDGDKIRPAKKNETPIGIISSNPLIIGGVPTEWPKKYRRDEFGNLIMEEYEEEEVVPKKEKVTRERQKVEKKTITDEVTRTEIAFEKRKYIQKEISETIIKEVEEPLFEEVDLYDASGKTVIGKHQIPLIETYGEEIEVLDEKGQPVLVGTGKFVTKQRPKLNPEYDESQEYVSREERPEWNCVGLLGQVPLRKGQPVAPTWIKIKDISKKVELWLVR